MSFVVFGVDPGWGGCVAVIERLEGKRRVQVHKMPKTEFGIAALAKQLAERGARGLIEQVGPRPGEAAQNGWKFAANYFGWRMALICAGVPHALIMPQKWQAEFDLLVKGISKLPKAEQEAAKREKKRRQRDLAQGLFPKLRVTLENCDGLLIALYADRTAARITP